MCAGLYAPTSEEHLDADLTMEGSMPPSLNGVYVRVGPNPYHRPIGNYHWFDGASQHTPAAPLQLPSFRHLPADQHILRRCAIVSSDLR